MMTIVRARVENQKFGNLRDGLQSPRFVEIDAGRNYGNFILDEGTIKVCNLYTTGTKLNEAFNKTISSIRKNRWSDFP